MKNYHNNSNITLFTTFIDIFVEYAKNDSDIRAIGLGGSVLRGEADRWSDVDIFPFVSHVPSTGKAEDYVTKWANRLGDPIAIVSRGGSKDGYGIGIQVVFEPLVKVDFNLNDSLCLQSHPAWRKRQVLLDKDGYFTTFIHQQVDFWTDQILAERLEKNLRVLQNAFWIEYTKAYKCILTNQIWSATLYISRLRDFILYAVRWHYGVATMDHNSFKSVETLLEDTELSKELLDTHPRCTAQSATLSLYKCVEIFEKHLAEPFIIQCKLRKAVLASMPLETLINHKS